MIIEHPRGAISGVSAAGQSGHPKPLILPPRGHVIDRKSAEPAPYSIDRGLIRALSGSRLGVPRTARNVAAKASICARGDHSGGGT